MFNNNFLSYWVIMEGKLKNSNKQACSPFMLRRPWPIVRYEKWNSRPPTDAMMAKQAQTVTTQYLPSNTFKMSNISRNEGTTGISYIWVLKSGAVFSPSTNEFLAMKRRYYVNAFSLPLHQTKIRAWQCGARLNKWDC